jgi:DNA-directed RNA polymerase specialized sigma subunit
MMQIDKSLINMTQQEVALKLGMHRVTVNQIEKQAIKKIKRELERRNIDIKLFFKD